MPGDSSYRVFLSRSGDFDDLGEIRDTSLPLGNLKSGWYTIEVLSDGGFASTDFYVGGRKCPPPPPPPHYQCAEVPHRVVLNSIGEGTNCQTVILPAGIGDPSLINAGVRDAIDIWGRASNVRFCFLSKQGSLVFVDTATSPRVVSNLAAEYINGMTCGSVDRTGQVALLRADVTASYATDRSTAPAATEAAPADICQLTTTGHLRVRTGPSLDDDIIGYVLRGARLRVISRSGGWFNIEIEDSSGWIGAAYVDTDCGDTVNLAPGPAPANETAAPAAAQPQDCPVTTTGHLRVRAGPSLDEGAIGFVRRGVTLRPISRIGSWLSFDYRGETGWIGTGFVSESGDCG